MPDEMTNTKSVSESLTPVELSSPDDHKQVPNHHKIFTSSLAGGIAGAVAKTVIAPFDRVKINFQVSNKRFCTRAVLLFLVDTCKTDGVTSLWRGNSATMVRIVPYASIQYASHEQFKILLNGGGDKYLPPMQRFLAGALAGVTSTSATYPLDLVRARMAVTRKDTYQSITEVVVKTWKTEGFSTLYRGFIPTVIGVIPYAGTSFFTYETLKKLHTGSSLHPNILSKLSAVHFVFNNLDRPISPLHRMCYGALAGACGQSFTYPLDIVRRRMQTEGVVRGKDRTYHSILGTMKYIIKEEGFFRGMYKGLTLNWIKGPIAVGTSFMTFETVQEFLRRFSVFHN